VDQGTPGSTATFIDDTNFVCVVWSMAISKSALYWVSIFDGVIAAHLSGAPNPADPPRMLVPPELTENAFDTSPRQIVVLPPNLYFTTGDGKLKRVAESGGAVTTVVESGVNPNIRISADANGIYWVASGADQIPPYSRSPIYPASHRYAECVPGRRSECDYFGLAAKPRQTRARLRAGVLWKAGVVIAF
jgi:hypothetical protein